MEYENKIERGHRLLDDENVLVRGKKLHEHHLKISTIKLVKED